MKTLFPEVSYTAIETHATKICYEAEELNLPDMSVVSLSGIISDPSRFWSLSHSDRLPKDCLVSEIADSSGEWTALASHSESGHKEYLCFSDPSGFAPIFYSLVSGVGLVLSDTFSGAVQGVRRLGGKLSLDIENYLTLVSSQTTFFQNLISSRTMANEIGIVPFDKALYVNRDRVYAVSRRSFSAAARVTNYDTALDQGIASAVSTIECIMNENPSSTYAITLTGGADSRMVFGLLSMTGRAKEFGLWTIDPRDRKSAYQKRVFTADVEIANELRERYGLKWVAPFTKKKLSLSYEESMAIHQSHKSNFAFTHTPTNAISYNVTPAVTLRGGGGEILRGTGGALVMSSRYEKYRAAGGSSSDISWLVKEYLKGATFTTKAKSVAHNFLSKVLNQYCSNSLRESVDSYYRNTRNRAHFGHIRKTASVNDRLLQVLSGPYLLRAMELISYEEKLNGKLVLDLLDRTVPELRDVPFENKNTDKQLRRRNAQGFMFHNRDGWVRGFDKRGKPSRSVGFRTTMEPGARLEDWQFSVAERNASFILSGTDHVLDMTPPDYRELLADQHIEIVKRLDMRSQSANILSAKIASAIDVFDPMALDIPGRHVYTDLSRETGVSRSNIIRTKAHSYYRIFD